MIRMKSDHHARTPSCFAVADRPVPECHTAASLAVATGAYLESVEADARPGPHSGCTQ
jgi:hypothetical protein